MLISKIEDLTGYGSKLSIRCQNNHDWNTTWGSLKKGYYNCPHCVFIKYKQKAIKKINKFVISKGGLSFLNSDEFRNQKTKFEVRCKAGHTWTTYSWLLAHNIWCQECGGNYHRVGLDAVKNFVKHKHAGKCLSTTYINSKLNLIFECKYGHQWYASWGNIKSGKWCSQCSSFAGERITRLYLEEIFGDKFNKCKPVWLLTPDNNRMELDGYCESLGIAFEHQGLQHFKINEFSNTEEKLKKRQLYDRLKITLCAKNNVKLIIIPQVPKLTTIDNLKNFILQKCNELDIKINKNLDDLVINFDLEPISNEYLKKYKKMAMERGGQCLSSAYINCDTKLKFICAEKHEFDIVPQLILNGYWCKICKKIAKQNRKKV